MKRKYIRNEKGIIPFMVVSLLLLTAGIIVFVVGLVLSFNSEVDSTTNLPAWVNSYYSGDSHVRFVVNPIFFVGLGLMVFGLFGSIISLVAIRSIHYAKSALNGHRTKGTVLSSVITNYKGHSSLEVEIKYTTDLGEDYILVLQTNAKYNHLYKAGDNIPIYVNGEYANVNEMELQEDYLKRTKKN